MNCRNSSGNAMPGHIAIIMDGNGRWAQARGLPRTAGHQAGAKAVRRIVEDCVKIGVSALTLYTFSTENWARPLVEVEFIMRLLEDYARQELSELHQEGIRLRLLGRRDGLPASLLRAMDETIAQTRNNTRMTLYLALNYGGRTELIDATRAIIAANERGEIESLDKATINRYLYAPDMPAVDLVIRTGGEYRLSNFLIWQSVNAVLCSLPVLWPDFAPDDLNEGIELYRGQITSQ